MKIARCTDGGTPFWAIVDTTRGEVTPIAGAFDDWAPGLTRSGGAQPPLNYSDFIGISPLGNLSPPNHIRPTNHLYFNLRFVSQSQSSWLTAKANVVAPGNLTIFEINSNNASRAAAISNLRSFAVASSHEDAQCLPG